MPEPKKPAISFDPFGFSLAASEHRLGSFLLSI